MPQNAYQDAVNAIALLAFAAQLIAILVVIYAFAILAHAILEEDAILHAIMYVIMIAKKRIYFILYCFFG